MIVPTKEIWYMHDICCLNSHPFWQTKRAFTKKMGHKVLTYPAQCFFVPSTGLPSEKSAKVSARPIIVSALVAGVAH